MGYISWAAFLWHGRCLRSSFFNRLISIFIQTTSQFVGNWFYIIHFQSYANFEVESCILPTSNTCSVIPQNIFNFSVFVCIFHNIFSLLVWHTHIKVHVNLESQIHVCNLIINKRYYHICYIVHQGHYLHLPLWS